MAKTKQTDPDTVAKNLYKKNLDLFNANRSLELLQKLYAVIVTNFQVKGVTQHFIDEIVKDLGFSSGMVFTKHSKTNSLRAVAHTQSKLNQALSQASSKPISKFSVPLTNKRNLLVKSYKFNKKIHTDQIKALAAPYITDHQLDTVKETTKPYFTLIVPITFGSKTLGCFTLSSIRAEHKLSPFETAIIKRVATVFGIAIDRVIIYQTLRKANRDLRHLDKLKDEFVFVATHELKTPVAVLRGYLNMISDGTYGKVPEKMKVALAELESANQQLINLVNDLLEIARSEAKSIKIKTSPTPLCKCVDNAVKNLKTLADQKHLTLSHTCNIKKLKVLADPDRLQEILNNLISNAIKYSDKGDITITHVTEGKQIITHVADTGIGISTDDQKKVFGRFFRAEERASKTPGTGLGLFIVKQLVEKMGGKIWFTSKLGQGTTFSFSLPKT